jgi:hypothetical protein
MALYTLRDVLSVSDQFLNSACKQSELVIFQHRMDP